MKGREFSGMVGMVTLMRIHASRAQYVTISGCGASMKLFELRYGDRVKWGNEGSDRAPLYRRQLRPVRMYTFCD